MTTAGNPSGGVPRRRTAQRAFFVHAPLALAVLLGQALAPPVLAQDSTRQVSVATGGEPAFCGDPNNLCYSVRGAISADGTFIAFSGVAQNLVPGPQNNRPQLYLHDLLTCTTIRVTETPAGEPSNGNTDYASLSADGRYLAFNTSATNLIPGGTSGTQVFVYDSATGMIELISANPLGFSGNGTSTVPTISADGRYVCFMSLATDLVPGAVDDNGAFDIFVRDRHMEQTVRVSVNSAGEGADAVSNRPSMSANARYVVFDSTASNLSSPATSHFSVYLHDRDANNTGVFDEPGGITTTEISVNSDGIAANNSAWWATVSDDGQKVAFYSRANNLAPGITNNQDDVFVRDVVAGVTTRESVGPGGAQASAGSYMPKISPDGRYLVFHSAALQLVSGGHNGATHIFRRDLTTGVNLIVSRNSAGQLGNSSSEDGAMTPDGRTIAFASAATNLGAVHVNPWVDMYVRSFESADLNRDGVVDMFDVAILQYYWDASCSTADVNGDGIVDELDLALFFANYQ